MTDDSFKTAPKELRFLNMLLINVKFLKAYVYLFSTFGTSGLK